MAQFLIAQAIAMQEEGGYCNTQGDKGGETYCGISRVFNQNWGGWQFIDKQKDIAPIKFNHIFPEIENGVNDYYEKNYWNNILGDKIELQGVSNYFYDWHVNSGGAVKQVQKVIDCQVCDGIFGEQSLELLNSKNWLQEIHDARIAYYHSIASGENIKFLNGWLERANKVYLLCTT